MTECWRNCLQYLQFFLEDEVFFDDDEAAASELESEKTRPRVSR